jgi:hypothetical protein
MERRLSERRHSAGIRDRRLSAGTRVAYSKIGNYSFKHYN